jgi:hypothetical protein
MKTRTSGVSVGVRFSFLLVALLATALLAAPAEAQVLQLPYLELGGNGLLGSVGYELQPLPHFGVRAGITVVPICLYDWCSALVVTPIAASYWLGEGSHHFEFGAGATLGWAADDDARFWTASAGYRYQRPEGGLVLRVFATAFVRMNEPSDVLPWPGASVGYAF